jgi:ABC-type transporter Mla maintaining outer membrane lipid asymmetry ATPase subunit MlaF
VSTSVLELSRISKSYHALRPLRIEQLVIEPGEHVAVTGVDQHAAEVLVNLVTGATLPDHGEVRFLGRPTSSISDSTEWLAMVDRFGIVSERAVLLDRLSVVQNLAIPFSLDIEPLGAALRERAIELAREVGLQEGDVDRLLGELGSASRLRVRLGRALALDPAIVVFEHPSAALTRDEAVPTGRGLRCALERRGLPEGTRLASLTLTADLDFAGAIATRVLALEPVSGRLAHRRRRIWF